MPTIYQRIEEQGSSILDVVTQQVVTGLLDELDMTKIFEDSVYILHSFSAYSQYDDGTGSVSLQKNRCDVDVSFVMDKTQVPWPVDNAHSTTAYGVAKNQRGTHTPIFYDKKAGILIEHRTVACALDMEFKLTFQSIDNATKYFDIIKSKYTGSLVGRPFDLVFSYPVSRSLFNYLASVYDAKADFANKSLVDYIDAMKVGEISFDVRKSELTKENADVAMMVRCQQMGCVAQLTMDQKEPDVERIDQLPDSFGITFQYQIQFARPHLVVIHTPLSVDNKLLPYEFFENIEHTAHHNNQVTGVFSDLMIHEYAKRSYGDFRNMGQIVRLPTYDDWFSADGQYAFYEYRPVLIAHFTLDGPVTQIDLKQLDDLQLHSVVQTIIRETGNEVFNYGGLFNLAVYANDLRLGQELVSIDDDLILTIRSDRPDKIYHLMISETTAIKKTDPKWDYLLIRYRYFFPMTIERNLEHLIKKRYFYIAYDDSFLNLINRLNAKGQLKPLLTKMVADDEDTNEIFSYTQNASQLADYLVYTQSKRKNYKHPLLNTGLAVNDAQILSQYYEREGEFYVLHSANGERLFGEDGKLLLGYSPLPDLPLLLQGASIHGRSLFVAFIEQCLIAGYIGIDDIPTQYLQYNEKIYPYANSAGGYYGFNSPIRVFKYNIRT